MNDKEISELAHDTGMPEAKVRSRFGNRELTPILRQEIKDEMDRGGVQQQASNRHHAQALAAQDETDDAAKLAVEAPEETTESEPMPDLEAMLANLNRNDAAQEEQDKGTASPAD